MPPVRSTTSRSAARPRRASPTSQTMVCDLDAAARARSSRARSSSRLVARRERQARAFVGQLPGDERPRPREPPVMSTDLPRNRIVARCAQARAAAAPRRPSARRPPALFAGFCVMRASNASGAIATCQRSETSRRARSARLLDSICHLFASLGTMTPPMLPGGARAAPRRARSTPRSTGWPGRPCPIGPTRPICTSPRCGGCRRVAGAVRAVSGRRSTRG